MVRWSGIDVLTQYPGSEAGPSTADPWTHNWPSGHGNARYEEMPDCDDDCNRHSESVHDAFRLLRARQMIPFRFVGNDWGPQSTDDLLAWLRIMTWTSKDGDAQRHGNLHQISSPAQDLAHLPIPATRLNAELVRICKGNPEPPPLVSDSRCVCVSILTERFRRLDVKLISRFKACLDGNPDSSNPYTKFYVPYCIQTPLLAQVAIYTSACFLNETGHLDRMVAMAHKGQAIRMLNDHLRSKSSTSDEAITAVIQLILDEWYWGETGDLRAHLRGLREMIRLRGGLRNLGMHGMISKLALA